MTLGPKDSIMIKKKKFRPFSYFEQTLFCPCYAPGHRLCKDAAKMVEAAKYPLQRQQNFNVNSMS